MSLTVEQRLTQHELKDEERHGQTIAAMARVEGKIDVLMVRVGGAEKAAESAEDKAETTGSYQIAATKNVLGIILKSIGAVALVLVAAVVGHYIK